jgi:hypothetical protein
MVVPLPEHLFRADCTRDLVVMSINTVTFVALNLTCGEARGGRIPGKRAVTDEQRSHGSNSTQPEGRRCFWAQASLLAPYRPLTGMLVARA